jgi:hypothetical protein
MPQCKYCGQVTVWPQPYVKGQRPNDPDTGLPHDCPAFKGDKYIDTKPQEREREEPAQAQGPNRYESAYLIPKEDWNHMLEFVQKISAQLTHLSEFYDSVMQEIEALRAMAHEQQSYRKHQQTLAEAEGQYDNDKEHGLA